MKSANRPIPCTGHELHYGKDDCYHTHQTHDDFGDGHGECWSGWVSEQGHPVTHPVDDNEGISHSSRIRQQALRYVTGRNKSNSVTNFCTNSCFKHL
ncbi:hypothetical protein HOLleu_30158 [Holothuria leucospilota]|uniref:Uncharacterized protein n=1 Tax=Holothuria leucospilota TaxID=206669 RepID=A0A9Q1GYE5_HOLLE|nr:hypothetical protein HOLleu_30158 [Holothuria leucospilota]